MHRLTYQILRNGYFHRQFICCSGGLARGGRGAFAPPADPKKGGAKKATGRHKYLPASAISGFFDYNIASHLINSCNFPSPHPRVTSVAIGSLIAFVRISIPGNHFGLELAVCQLLGRPGAAARAFFCSHVYLLLHDMYMCTSVLLLHCICATTYTCSTSTVMMSEVPKRKKSGASSRKLKKARVEEGIKLGAFMKNYLTACSASTVSGSIDSDLKLVSEAEVTPAQSSYDNITVPSDNDLKTSSSNPSLCIQSEDHAGSRFSRTNDE